MLKGWLMLQSANSVKKQQHWEFSYSTLHIVNLYIVIVKSKIIKWASKRFTFKHMTKFKQYYASCSLLADCILFVSYYGYIIVIMAHTS